MWTSNRAVQRVQDKVDDLNTEVAELTTEVHALRAERQSISDELGLSDEVIRLRRQVTEAEIARDRQTETHDREIRETEHRVGLLRIQQEHEVTNARRETELEVREGNLDAERSRFERDMTFQRNQLSAEVERVAAITTELMKRLPVIDVALTGQTGPRPVPDAEAG